MTAQGSPLGDRRPALLEPARAWWPAAQQHAERTGWRAARHDHPDVPTCVLELRP